MHKKNLNFLIIDLPISPIGLWNYKTSQLLRYSNTSCLTKFIQFKSNLETYYYSIIIYCNSFSSVNIIGIE